MAQLVEWEDFGAQSTGTFILQAFPAKLVYTVGRTPEGGWIASCYGKPITSEKVSRDAAKNCCDLDVAHRLSMAHHQIGQLMDEIMSHATPLSVD